MLRVHTDRVLSCNAGMVFPALPGSHSVNIPGMRVRLFV